ncbi:MAG: hypothetical protein COV33_02280 [Candidatus Zambryskibacteria bacterium CG10_big_fil_rev_8_21_14_0_10_34_34]|uniref:Small ribosomal subunit protein bS6 n=1 Tax=Candidatus Zambryskibacteria bacterium CG10_big_fil_rev_8_21_14_0_10_34_34 TaxID=1975114 RepID=A0A2H0R0E6_9BACT|nr:MAG: hypothetical protein COV33_02280 [Candidatus Zambryskibacteria bacterium CG10_big_fil_rev_8_21_14_0_10_34_34]
MKEDILEESQVYEVGFHLLPTVPEENLEAVVTNLQSLITKGGGTIISEEFPKMRPLAYDIKKRIDIKHITFSKAYFGWVKFEATSDLLGKINNGFKTAENVLRFIIVKTVRENTMQLVKSPISKRDENREEKSIPTVEKPSVKKVKISDDELDKSIDQLVTDQIL